MRRRHGWLPHAPPGCLCCRSPFSKSTRSRESLHCYRGPVDAKGGYTERVLDPDILSPCSLNGQAMLLVPYRNVAFLVPLAKALRETSGLFWFLAAGALRSRGRFDHKGASGHGLHRRGEWCMMKRQRLKGYQAR
jgi:hypothetical protein